jgi:hypothetical protein
LVFPDWELRSSADIVNQISGTWARRPWRSTLSPRAPPCNRSTLLSSSQHGCIRTAKLLAWQQSSSENVLENQVQAAWHSRLSLRSHSWSLLLHSICCKEATSPLGL